MHAAASAYWEDLLERVPNRSQAARIAGVHRTHVYRMINRLDARKRYDIKPPRRGKWGEL
jgi:hypothetical protein